MSTYKYVITDTYGKTKKGITEAVSEEIALQKLHAEGSVVHSIQKKISLDDQKWNIQIGSGVSLKEMSLFCRQFHSVLEAGVSVIEGLRMIQEQTDNKNLRRALLRVQINVEKGETLASAMEYESSIFPSILINMVAAGEATGNLEKAFQRVATQFEKDTKLTSLVRQTMIYPVAVLVISTIVVAILMIFVVPNFESVFSDIGKELPLPTRIVIGVSHFLVNNIPLIVVVLCLLIGGIVALKITERGKMFTSRVALFIPPIRKYSVKSSAAKLCNTMSTLIVAGVPLVEALGIVARVIENRVIRKSLLEAREDVLQGIPLSEPLENAGIMPPMVCHMIRIGEETGTTEQMLDKIADYYEEDVENTTKALTSIIEPIIIVILAIIVGGIISAIILPMVDMNKQIGT